jgi:hypothetical protein
LGGDGIGIWFSPIITSALYYVSLDCRPTQSTEIWTRPTRPLEIPDWVIAVHQKEWTGLDHRRPSSPSSSPPWPVKNTVQHRPEVKFSSRVGHKTSGAPHFVAPFCSPLCSTLLPPTSRRANLKIGILTFGRRHVRCSQRFSAFCTLCNDM